MLEDSRPRERLLRFGVENLSDAEILALILMQGTCGENVVDMSGRLIARHGLDRLSECSLRELQEIRGIGFAKACQIIALFEFNRRHSRSKRAKAKISCAQDVYDLFYDQVAHKKQENFIVLMLETKNNVGGYETVSKGILDSAIVHPREIFKPAIKNSASRIILIHNHPSGDPTPSDADLRMTLAVMDAGNVMKINVLDHVIVGENGWWSHREDNCFKQ